MPRPRIPRAIFSQPPEYGYCMIIKGWSYWFIKADVDESGALILYWFTRCSRCGAPFIDESRLSVFWLHKRCPRHRRKQLPLDKRIMEAIRALGKLSRF